MGIDNELLVLVLAVVVSTLLLYSILWRRRRGRLGKYMIDLRVYKKYVGRYNLAPKPIPWFLSELTSRELDVLIENRNRAWSIYRKGRSADD